MELFPFRYRDPLTGRWIHARYKATRDELTARYAEHEITGPAEAREGDAATPTFPMREPPK